MDFVLLRQMKTSQIVDWRRYHNGLRKLRRCNNGPRMGTPNEIVSAHRTEAISQRISYGHPKGNRLRSSIGDDFTKDLVRASQIESCQNVELRHFHNGPRMRAQMKLSQIAELRRHQNGPH